MENRIAGLETYKQAVSFHKAPDARDKCFRSLDNNIIQTVFLQKFLMPFKEAIHCGYLRCKEKSPSTSENMLGSYESLGSILLRCSISSGHGEGLPFKPSVEYRP